MAFQFFLVSSQVHQEKNALSEAAWILSSYTKIEQFKAKLLPVGGLGLLQVENGFDIPSDVQETILAMLEKEKLYYCFKIIPLEFFDIFSEEAIFNWLDSKLTIFKDFKTWKVDINKRHSSVDKRTLIAKIAKNISNSVDLKNPNIILQIEIIGKFVGLGILQPYQLIQLSSLLCEPESQLIADQEEELDSGV